MAVKKIEIKPKGTGDYADVLYPKTSADMVIDEVSGTTVAVHLADNVKHVTSTERTRWNNTVNAINIGTQNTDPNTAQEAYILTDHVNSPGIGRFWHIQTFFYSTRTGNRAQQAISYNGTDPQIRVRHCFNDVWTPWSADPFQSVVDGKNSVENAIEAKGGTVSDVNNPPTFADLVAGINGLSTGKKFATGTVTLASSVMTVTGLTFLPSMIVWWQGTTYFGGWTSLDSSTNYIQYAALTTDNASAAGASSQATVSSTGFSINLRDLSGTINWIAYE